MRVTISFYILKIIYSTYEMRFEIHVSTNHKIHIDLKTIFNSLKSFQLSHKFVADKYIIK